MSARLVKTMNYDSIRCTAMVYNLRIKNIVLRDFLRYLLR